MIAVGADLSTDEQLRVWYDGDCRLCRQSRDWCQERVSPSRVRFIDFRGLSDDRLPVPRHELESSMWVQTVGGGLFSGFDGWRQILFAVPRWRWLAQLSGMAPFRWLGPRIYRLVARVRKHLPALRSQLP